MALFRKKKPVKPREPVTVAELVEKHGRYEMFLGRPIITPESARVVVEEAMEAASDGRLKDPNAPKLLTPGSN